MANCMADRTWGRSIVRGVDTRRCKIQGRCRRLTRHPRQVTRVIQLAVNQVSKPVKQQPLL